MFNFYATTFTAIVLLSSCCSGALLGVNRCSYGPSYWCNSIQKAKECNAVKHCIQAVWKNQILPEDNDDICTICVNMVQEARDQLQSNETQEELKEVFEGSCKLIPIKAVTDECIKLSDEFIPELIETLASEMNPQVVCATAGLCNSVTVDRLIREYKAEHPGVEFVPKKWKSNDPAPGDCKDCHNFINDVVRLVKTHDRSETLNRLLAICGQLGTLSDGCMALVEANFQTIYDYLSDGLKSDDFCDFVGMCERMYGSKTVPFTKTNNGDEGCDFCVSIVKHWREVLTANTTEEEFKEILVGLCKQTGSFKDECLSLVNEYYLPLYQMLISEIQPMQICEAVGLCGIYSVFSEVETPVWPLINLRPEDMLPVVNDFQEPKNNHIIGLDETAALALDHPDVLPRVSLETSNIKITPAGNKGVIGVSDDNVCVMCESTLHFLQNLLHENDTREQIEDAVEQVCSLMPKTVAEECDDYVDAYGDQIIDLLSQEIDPSVICPLLGFCHKKQELVTVEKDDTSCLMCEFALNQLEDMIKDNKTEASIKSSLEKLCTILPKTVKKDCVQFVDKYSDQVIQLLINDLNPDEVCTQLGLCKKVSSSIDLVALNPSHQLPISRMFIPKLNEISEEGNYKTKQSGVCILCEFVLKEIDNEITDNKTMDEIERVVEFVCAHLPGSVQEDCISFVEEYGDSIIELLSKHLDPKEVCQQMSLCKQSTLDKIFSATVDLNVDQCFICEELINFVDEKLQEPDTTTDIDSLLENVCSILPQKIRRDCRDVIEVYGPYVVNMLEELGHDSKKVCQAMELCPNHVKTQLLGAEKCTWGPSYWCQTQLHAKACKATSHCESKVWTSVKPKV